MTKANVWVGLDTTFCNLSSDEYRIYSFYLHVLLSFSSFMI